MAVFYLYSRANSFIVGRSSSAEVLLQGNTSMLVEQEMVVTYFEMAITKPAFCSGVTWTREVMVSSWSTEFFSS